MNENNVLPRLSVVTPCLNRAHMIERAVESVLAQNYPNVEHVIADGGSTDGTLDILKKYPHLRVISEPDKNLYDGLNKGIRAATGDVIGHLNSDDFYADNVFQEVMQPFIDDPRLEMVGGGALVIDGESEEKQKILYDFSADSFKEPSLENALLGVPIPNARFLRRCLPDRVGLMNIRYPLISDRDFLYRAAVSGVQWASVKSVVYYYVAHEGSLSIKVENNVMRRLYEKIGMAEDYLQAGGLPPQALAIFKKWHNRETIEAALRTAYAGDWKQAWNLAQKGMRYDAQWPLVFFRNAFPRILRYGWRALTPTQRD
jgi:glycosyltransferase involved in cell wall biosynthesis